MIIQSDKIQIRKGQWSGSLIAMLCLGVLLAGIWIYLARHGNSQARELRKRIPEINTTYLSSRANKILESCRESIRLAPGDAMSWGLLGRACLAHQFQGEAAQCFEVAAELDSQNPEWFYCQALALEGTQSKKCIQLIKSGIRLGGKYQSTMQCKLAGLLFEEGEYKECKLLLRAVIDGSARNLRANMLLARVLLNENDIDESLKCATIVFDGQPGRKEALRLISLIHSRLGNSAKANEFAKKAADPLSFDFPWPDEIAQKIWDLRKDVNSLVNNAMNLPPAMINQRIKVLRDAVEEEPHEPNWHGFLGQTLLQVRQFQQAEKALVDGIGLHPQSAVLHYTLGLVYLNQKKINPAINAIKKAVTIKPDYDSAYLDLGIAYREQENYKNAQDAFEKAIQILPGNFKAHLNSAVTFEIAGEDAQAISAYRECLKLDEKSSEVYFLLGKLLAKSAAGKPEAKLLLEKTIEIDPGFSEAKQLLEKLK